ncbi:MAG: haloacid dehalogenase type II, partial [Candidatus Bathyarchaeia archaeon]
TLKAITFDVFGTLLDWEGGLEPAVKDVLKEAGSQASSNAFLANWRNRQLEFSMMNTLVERRHEKFTSITRRALVSTCRAMKVRLTKDAEAKLTGAWFSLPPFPDARHALSRLKTQFKLAPLSNGDRAMLAKALKVARFNFDAIIAADMIGAYKPSPKVYLTAAEILKLPPSSILHASGNQFDVYGAKLAGLKVAWVNRRAAALEEWGIQPDLEVNSLTHLADKLLPEP